MNFKNFYTGFMTPLAHTRYKAPTVNNGSVM